ncbi:hypothetical protein BC831DRAFT_457876 [Entophlyctis helioformis]|nr:hypothetical protein BC831DRAFT_457876 [Entophlyctis helioformis]
MGRGKQSFSILIASAEPASAARSATAKPNAVEPKARSPRGKAQTVDVAVTPALAPAPGAQSNIRSPRGRGPAKTAGSNAALALPAARKVAKKDLATTKPASPSKKPRAKKAAADASPTKKPRRVRQTAAVAPRVAKKQAPERKLKLLVPYDHIVNDDRPFFSRVSAWIGAALGLN